MTKYIKLCSRKVEAFGEMFHSDDLAKQFIQYYNSGERIKVKFSDGEIKIGTIGITTGWSPCFLLMLRKDSISSCYTLSSTDEVIRNTIIKK